MILQTDITPIAPAYYQPQHQRRRGMKPTHKGLIIWHVVAVCYYLCSRLCDAQAIREGTTLLDLSHIFDNTTIYWVTAKPLTFNVTHNGTIDGRGYWYQSDEISAATHGGTHMDSPCHFAKGRWCISDIPLERMIVETVVVDISDKVKNDPDVHLTKNDLVEWEQKHGKIPDKSLLMERDVSLLRFPSILPEVAEWLVANRNIVGVGIDTMSIDVPNTIPLTHVTLMEKNIYALENVNNLKRLPPTGSVVYAMPMKLKDASGAPCRVFAQIPLDSATSGQCRISLSTYLIIAIYVIMF